MPKSKEHEACYANISALRKEIKQLEKDKKKLMAKIEKMIKIALSQ